MESRLAFHAERPRALAGTLGEEAIAFGELDTAAERLAAGLRGAGIGRGDVVVWWSGPSLDSLVVMTACARVGAVFAPLSPLLGEAEALRGETVPGSGRFAIDSSRRPSSSGSIGFVR